MRSCRWTSDGPIDVGSTYEQRAAFLGRPIDSTFEVAAFAPGRSITITTTESTFPITVTRSVEPQAECACLVRAQVSGDPSKAFRVAAPAMRWMVQRSVRADYARLKALLEACAHRGYSSRLRSPPAPRGRPTVVHRRSPGHAVPGATEEGSGVDGTWTTIIAVVVLGIVALVIALAAIRSRRGPGPGSEAADGLGSGGGTGTPPDPRGDGQELPPPTPTEPAPPPAGEPPAPPPSR